jgi:hypothetical protein
VLVALDDEQDGECLLTHVKLLAGTGVVTARVLHVVEQATVVGFSTIKTAMEVLSYAVLVGTPPKCSNAATWPTWKVSVHSLG